MQAIFIILFGLVGGLLAWLAIARGNRLVWIPSAILGVGGALCSAFVARSAGLYREGDSIALVVWFVGALAVATIYDAGARHRAVT